MRNCTKETHIITRDKLQRIIRSHTLKPLVNRISKLLQFRSRGDKYVRELMFRKSIHPEHRCFRDKWELVIFLRKKIINLKNALFPFVQRVNIENTEIAIEDWMAAIIVYTQQKELYHLFYYLRKIELDIKKLLLEIKKLRRQLTICQALEASCEEIKYNMEKLLNKYDYYKWEKDQVMVYVKKIETKLLDKWLFYNGYKELDKFTFLQNEI
jgi:hypothetical protein